MDVVMSILDFDNQKKSFYLFLGIGKVNLRSTFS